jgi:hypothetical protein
MKVNRLEELRKARMPVRYSEISERDTERRNRQWAESRDCLSSDRPMMEGRKNENDQSVPICVMMMMMMIEDTTQILDFRVMQTSVGLFRELASSGDGRVGGFSFGASEIE